jgi:hypothetical protein
MKALLIAFILGMVVATVGLSGLAKIFDRGIETVKTQAQELSK